MFVNIIPKILSPVGQAGYIGGILLDLVRYSCPNRFVNATGTAKHYPLVDRFNGLIRTQMIRYFDWRLAPRCYLST